MSFETESRVAELMRNIERNIEIATENPDLVLRTQFKGISPSGDVTVWSDAIGRVERVAVAPGSVREGEEARISDEFLAAVSNARAAAERLDPDGAAQNDKQRGSNQQANSWEDEAPWGDSGSFLQ